MTARTQDRMPFVPLGDVLTNSRKNSLNVITAACIGFSVPLKRSLLSLPALLRFLVLCLLTAMIDRFPLAWLIISWLKIDTSFCSSGGSFLLWSGDVFLSVVFPCQGCLKISPMFSCSLFTFKVHLLNRSLALLLQFYRSSSALTHALTTCSEWPLRSHRPDSHG